MVEVVEVFCGDGGGWWRWVEVVDVGGGGLELICRCGG